MRQATNYRRRFILMAGVTALAMLGLTACDADHYYAFFDNSSPSQPGPDCAVYCVKYGDVIDPSGTVVVHPGDTVGFYNLATGTYEPAQKTTLTVTLTYKYPDNTGVSRELTIKEGKSKNVKIKNDVPIGTRIEVLYYVGTLPGHGGPDMIVQP